ncbi:MAG: GTP 3',8-cyclase MoaA [Spirochaetota bacterium]
MLPNTPDKLGRPLRDLRISLTDRCNFRCSYCMPENVRFQDKSQLLRFEEIELIVQAATQLGVEKIKITGGEPTLRADLDILIAKLLQNPAIRDLGLITNGWYLKAQGEKLYRAGLRRISVSLDALDNRVFRKIVGTMYRYNVEPILEGLAHMESLGFSPIKINSVIQRGLNEDQILPLVEYFAKPGYHLRFIEFMDVGAVRWQGSKVVSSQEIYEIICAKYPLQAKESAYYGEVARRYTLGDMSNTEIGFISSVSEPFCKSCTRLRLSSDGTIYGCLFSGKGFPLKPILRDSGLTETRQIAKIRKALAQFWSRRDDRYSELRGELSEPPPRENMHFMGG